MIKPTKLKRGDTIGIVSPSWGGAGLFPHRVEQGVQYLRSLGFEAKLAPHALNRHGFVSDTPRRRVEDIHAMFLDPEVAGIIATIAGDHSCHLLPLLDFTLIPDHPKIFVGYSDVTVLNVAIWKKTGVITFNGPALLTDAGEYPRMLEYTERYFLRATTESSAIGQIEPSTAWTEEFQDWETQVDRKRPRILQQSEGWMWLKPGQAEGRLIGGCLESLQHLRGTEFWPDWEDAIWFFETSEEKPSPETVDALLMDYENMGVFEKIRGLIVGRPMRYSLKRRYNCTSDSWNGRGISRFRSSPTWISGIRPRSSRCRWGAGQGSTRTGSCSRSSRPRCVTNVAGDRAAAQSNGCACRRDDVSWVQESSRSQRKET
jgi:muramoyltetrapeptide carboxypeptidase LdcA involved in peptidoglycan recycling